MKNVVTTWLWLIGTKENAAKLRLRLENLKSPPLDPEFGPEPLQCPLTVLYGAEASRLAYAADGIRPALDAWDNGAVDVNDLRRWCLAIERGDYTQDSRFDPGVNAGVVRALTRTRLNELARKEQQKRIEQAKVDRKDKPESKFKRYKPIDWSVID